MKPFDPLHLPQFPDYCNPLIGYRHWNASSLGLLLGTNHSDPWLPYQAKQAQCYGAHVDASAAHLRTKDHYGDTWLPAPQLNCSCGTYAMKTEKQLMMRDRAYRYSFMYEAPEVHGSVKLWGRVIEHENGWRAEYAYPFELSTADKHLAQKIERLYGVTCVVRETEEELEDHTADLMQYIFGGPLIKFTPLNVSMPRSSNYAGVSRSSMLGLYNQLTATPPPSPPPAPLTIHPATWAQIRAIGATRYQRTANTFQQRTYNALFGGARAGKHWTQILRSMVHLKPEDDAEKTADRMTVKGGT